MSDCAVFQNGGCPMSDVAPAAADSHLLSAATELPVAIETARVTEMTQDVRFAVSMTGGVSLAVWMGGVSREVNLLQHASDSRAGNDSAATLWATNDPADRSLDRAGVFCTAICSDC
jgi:hypothetical protein